MYAPPSPLGAVSVEPGDRAAWEGAVDAAVTRIAAGELEKVVLARAVSARLGATRRCARTRC